MIKKTFLLLAIMFSVNFLIRDILKPDIILYQDMWHQNYIRAQSYIYSNTDSVENIIVGSSLSMPGRIINDSLKDLNFLNIALPGEDPKDGLELIIKKNVFPKRLFVELNVILKFDDTGFANVVYNPVLYPLRRKIPTLRDGKQPMPLVAAMFHEYITQPLIPEKFAWNSNRNKEDNKTKLEIKDKIPDKKSETIEDKQKKAFERFKNDINFLVEKGVTIIFFEMPYDRCREGVIPLFTDWTLEAFPPDKYIYIPSPKCGSFKSTDGVHLEGIETERYSHYFRTQVDSLIRIGK
ncbi:MAG: hypothetical protein LBV43_08820 [Prevotella sp.]|jgi:hypothetical protein|nr:hypothetical protein [Prevotella sp.]